MMDRRKKNTLLPNIKLITKILEYSGYDLEEEESKIKRSKIGKGTLSQMRFAIESKEILLLPPKSPPRA